MLSQESDSCLTEGDFGGRFFFARNYKCSVGAKSLSCTVPYSSLFVTLVKFGSVVIYVARAGICALFLLGGGVGEGGRVDVHMKLYSLCMLRDGFQQRYTWIFFWGSC